MHPTKRILHIAACLFSLLLMACSPPLWSQLQHRAAASRENASLLNAKPLAIGDFEHWEAQWEEESEIPAQLTYLPADSTLDVVAPKGFTLWYRKPFQGNLTFRYQIRAVSGAGQYDRCSDLNCFFMASDPLHPDSIMARKAFRGGVFGKAYSLRMYYLGYGGNANTTTRFRRYDGNYEAFLNAKERPSVLKEYTDSAHLIQPNHWYSVQISIYNGTISCWFDKALLVDFQDVDPHSYGWFGFRTTQNHLQIRRFTVSNP